MVKSNYVAWHIDAQEFSDDWPDIQKLRFFARYAILAPSGHNTQPWRFSNDGQRLLLHADKGRILPYSGIEANEPHVSLGACLGILGLAAQGFGYRLSIDYVTQGSKVASIKIDGKVKADPTLLEAIVHRVSNRSFYEAASLSKSLLDHITQHRHKNVRLDVISSKEDIAFVAEHTVHATHKVMGDKEFRAELSKWVRNNVTRQYDGMPGHVQGIPTPPSMIARHIIKRVDISKDQAKKDSTRLLHSANLIIITIKNQSKEALLNAGSLYAEVCVRAQQRGIATSGVGTAIIEPDAREEIIKRFKLPGKPVAIIRLGKASKPVKHTPRWPLSAVSG